MICLRSSSNFLANDGGREETSNHIKITKSSIMISSLVRVVKDTKDLSLSDDQVAIVVSSQSHKMVAVKVISFPFIKQGFFLLDIESNFSPVF